MVYKRNIEKVKIYFDFPINKKGEEIWYFVAPDYLYAEARDTTREFTEKKFVRYFDKIFSKKLVKTLLKIKAEDLLTQYKTQSIEIKEGKYKKYFLSISVNSSKKSLYLNLDIDDMFT